MSRWDDVDHISHPHYWRKRAYAVMAERAEKELQEIQEAPRCVFCGRRKVHAIYLADVKVWKRNRVIACNWCLRAVRNAHNKLGVKYNVRALNRDAISYFMAHKIIRGFEFVRH